MGAVPCYSFENTGFHPIDGDEDCEFNLCDFEGGTDNGICCLQVFGTLYMQCVNDTPPDQSTFTTYPFGGIPAGNYLVLDPPGVFLGNNECYYTTIGEVEPYWHKPCLYCPDGTVPVFPPDPGDWYCAYCNEGDQYCEADGLCHEQDEPECKEALHCEWDPATCEWVCDDPSTICEGPGEEFDYCLCACVPGCPEGYYYSGSALDCVAEPECKDALHCRRFPPDCDYVCDDPDTICGPTREWLGEPDCRCEGSGGVWNLHTPIGHYHVADDLSGIRYRRAEDTAPPFTLDVAVTADTTDSSPRMVRDSYGRILLLWLRGTDVYETYSDDEGETWATATVIHMATTQVTIAKDRQTGMLLRGFLVDNALVLTRQYPGDAAPSEEIAAQLYPGPVPLTLDDAGFHLSAAPEGPARWLLVGVLSGAAVNYASSDDGETWLSVD